MGNSNLNHSSIKVLRWRDSLPIKFSIIQFIIASLIILSSVWLIFTIEKSHHLQTQIVLSQNHGLAFIATLEQTTTKIETLADSIASLGELYRSNRQVLIKSIPAILNADGKHQLITGGGIWPEPGAFNQGKERDSLFWARDETLELQQIEGYNSYRGPDYHQENWYKPVRFYPKTTPLWSQSYIDTYTKEAMLTASVPMWSEHQFLGVATIDISLVGLANFFYDAINAETESNGYIFALDHLNRIIAFPEGHTSPTLIENPALFESFEQLTENQPELGRIQHELIEIDNELINRAALHPIYSDEQLVELLQSSDPSQRDKLAALINLSAGNTFKRAELISSFEFDLKEGNGQPVLVSIFIMPKTFWRVVLITPLDSINEEANNIAARIGFYLVIMQLFGLVLLFLLQHRLFIQPISAMVSALKENKIAKLELEASTRHDEMGQLAQAFVFRNHQLEVAFASLDANNIALEEQVSVQKLAQKELKSNKLQLNSLLNPSHNLIFIKDINGSYTLVNNRFCEVVGVEKHVIIGKKDLQLFSPRIAEIILQQDKIIITTQQPHSFEQSVPSPHGDIIYQVTKYPIFDNEGELTAIGNMAFDISSQKIITQELHKSNQQLSAEIGEVTQEITLIQMRNNEQRELISQLEQENAYDAQQRNIDSNIYQLFPNMFSTLIKQQMLELDHLIAKECQNRLKADTGSDETLTVLTHHADTLRHFQHLLMSKNATMKATNLSQFITHFLAVFESKLKHEKINLVLECEQNISIKISSWDLLFLFYSIINNSLTHAFINQQNDKTITVNITQENEIISIYVEDNGVGLSSEKLQKLNEQLLSNANNRSLSILCAWLMTEHDGELIIESEINQFTRTTCHLPKGE
ncbi:PAS domain-containing protein [Shewanella sp. D64]|uniref:PDC sensor domain-containing protein n=1 Tax=unclassified Shewanella TaxID=196818 RepID=UPI0022BA4EBD|nr:MULTISPECIES: PAS domain-containing protein [unclassified Shewanella]MEC4724899.1 PAS domain-containing protein [Shewanella sp. D64]MEC4736308.1 PAS domain-containing protein [Shewanella sp. E94]WBJ97630.1 PAS domain-containing protein [Shewanella sp. MTB7]